MATAHAPLPQKQVERVSPQIQVTVPVQEKKKHLNPILIAMLAVMAVFPFVVQYLPHGWLQYLDLLYR